MISVIVPIYNVAPYLNRCLDSLRNQSYKNFEVIMVNDGSTDESGEIAKTYSKIAPQFVYIYQENKGQGAARNTGIRAAKGDYLAFVDSDDFVHKDYLKRLHEMMLSNGADISMCSVQRVWDNGRRTTNAITNDGTRVIEDVSNYLVKGSFSVWNKLYKKNLFDGLTFPERMKFEDFALLPRVIERAHKLVSSQDILYYYFWRSGSTTNAVKIQRDILKAQYILEDDSFSQRNPFAIKIFFIRQVMGTFLWSLMQANGNKEEVVSVMNRALARYPDLNEYMKDEFIGRKKSLWGKLLIKGHYKSACIYCRLYENSMSFARRIQNKIK